MSWLKGRLSAAQQEKVAQLEEELSAWDKEASTRLQKIRRGDREGVRAIDAELLARMQEEPLPGITYPTSDVDKRRQLARIREAAAVWEGTPRRRPEDPFRESLKRVSSFGEKHPVPELPADISPDALRELVRTARPEILEKVLTHPNLPLDLQEWAVDKFPEIQGASHTLPGGQVMPVKGNLELSKMMNPLAFQGDAAPPAGVPWVEEHPVRAGRKKEGPNMEKLRKQSPSLAQLVQERTYPSLEEIEAGILTPNHPSTIKLQRRARLPEHLKEELRRRKHARIWGNMPALLDSGLLQKDPPGDVAPPPVPSTHIPEVPVETPVHLPPSAPLQAAAQVVAEGVPSSPRGLVHLPSGPAAAEALQEGLPLKPGSKAPWLAGGVALPASAAYAKHRADRARAQAATEEGASKEAKLNPAVTRGAIAVGLTAALTAQQAWKRHKRKQKEGGAEGEKVAAPGPGILSRAWGATQPVLSRSWAPALAAAGVGATHGLISGTLDARNRGESWGDSVVEGVKSIPTSAAVGGAIGGVGSMISPGFADRTMKFSKGMLHSLTGWTPKGGLASLDTGSHSVTKQMDHLRAQGHTDPDLFRRLGEQRDALKAVEDQGLSSLPGLIKGMATKPLTTLRTSKDMLVKGLDGSGKVMLGLGVVGAAMPALTADDATPLERAGMLGRSVGGMLLTTPLQAPVMQAGLNTSLGGYGGMLEGILHNIPGGSAPRLLMTPADEVSRAHQRSRMARGQRALPHPSDPLPVQELLDDDPQQPPPQVHPQLPIPLRTPVVG